MPIGRCACMVRSFRIETRDVRSLLDCMRRVRVYNSLLDQRLSCHDLGVLGDGVRRVLCEGGSRFTLATHANVRTALHVLAAESAANSSTGSAWSFSPAWRLRTPEQVHRAGDNYALACAVVSQCARSAQLLQILRYELLAMRRTASFLHELFQEPIVWQEEEDEEEDTSHLPPPPPIPLASNGTTSISSYSVTTRVRWQRRRLADAGKLEALWQPGVTPHDAASWCFHRYVAEWYCCTLHGE